MKKTLLVIVALAGAVLGAQQTAVLTPAQTLERRGIGELELSPDSATSGCSTLPASRCAS
jgi:hypothetical protein